jgi:HPt (histidine-containing phosphotransfer) domain-containing protein
MKGSGGGYGFDEISGLGRDIEQAAKSENAEMISTLIKRLDDYLKHVEVVYE